jgi:aromatic ring-opening dioxygenase catalytic subunit (LigB family)
MSSNVKPMPVMFICHGGGPFGFMDTKDVPNHESFFKELDVNSSLVHFNTVEWPGILKNRVSVPRAILIITSHWVTGNDTFHISGKDSFSNYFDDFTMRFPGLLSEDSLKRCHYPAKVDLQLANQVKQLLVAKGLSAEVNTERDIDQGAFVPLVQLFPDAKIPIVTMSVLSSFDPEKHIAAGEALRPLREQGVLIIGSGSITHDLTRTSTADEAHAFVDKLKSVISDKEKRRTALINWKDTLPSAIKCNPPPEDHFIPLLVVVGSAGNSPGTILNEQYIWKGARSNASYLFDE